MARVTSTVTVQGQPGLVATNFNLPFGATGVEVVWKDGPDVNPVATGNGISRDEVLAVAQGVNYNAGDWPGPAPSSGCIGGIRVEGAISRSQALSDVPGSYAARLVRLTDLSSATGDELSQCTVKRCDPLVVVWIVASHDAGPMPRPSGATLPQGSALSIAVLNAASGANRGDSESGNGPLPAWWGTIRDYGQG